MSGSHAAALSSAATSSAWRARPAGVSVHPDTRPSRWRARSWTPRSVRISETAAVSSPEASTIGPTSANPFRRTHVTTTSRGSAGYATLLKLPPLPSGGSRCGGSRLSVLGDLVELLVLLARVGPVLEGDDAELGELLAQVAVGRVEQAELLAVGHDLREEHLLEECPLRCLHGEGDGFLHGDAEALPHLLLQESITHTHGGLEGELLALDELGG